VERIRVLVAEDEEAVREALADLLSADPAVSVVALAQDAAQAIELASKETPDVALIDVKMPEGGGPHAARGIHDVSPATRVIALSAYEDRRTVLEMLRAGAVGYVVKGTGADEILRAMRRSVRGQGSLSVEVTADVIDELVGLLERSETLTRELQELDRTKSELIQILSHELFTPMTAIQGFALLVAERGAEITPDEIRDLAHGVVRANDRLKRLVGNLSVAARLDRPGEEISTRPAQADDLVAAALAEFPQDQDRFVIVGMHEGSALSADPQLGSRAIVMLLENALAFTPRDRPIEIRIRPSGDRVEIAVLDTGPGIPEDLRDTIFQSFTQSDRSMTREHQGLGIGLFLVDRIMRAHRGGVSFAPRPGGGSAFTLGFPAVGSRADGEGWLEATRSGDRRPTTSPRTAVS
jgi:signal transduction histidine kinase